MVRSGLLSVNLILVAGVLWFIVRNPQASVARPVIGSSTIANDPLDQLTSARIAENVARLDNLPEVIPITNQADSEDAQLSIIQSSATLVAKPQVVATAFKSNKDIQSYVVKAGDTVASIAATFNITSDSVIWSNNIKGNTVTPGQKLYIPPVNGIVYSVKSGDTSQSLAQKYHAAQDQITAYNDAEISGLYAGEQIIIPNGQIQTVAPTSYAYGGGVASWGISAIYGSNGYDYGYCTWWVAQRRAQVGEPLPANLGNASTWAYLARLYGLSTGNTPQKYAAAVTSTYGEGHVVFVEAVNADGSITASEMNHLGWAIEDTRIFSASDAASFTYIY